jgi:uncharacterized protein YkwD
MKRFIAMILAVVMGAASAAPGGESVNNTNSICDRIIDRLAIIFNIEEDASSDIDGTVTGAHEEPESSASIDENDQDGGADVTTSSKEDATASDTNIMVENQTNDGVQGDGNITNNSNANSTNSGAVNDENDSDRPTIEGDNNDAENNDKSTDNKDENTNEHTLEQEENNSDSNQNDRDVDVSDNNESQDAENVKEDVKGEDTTAETIPETNPEPGVQPTPDIDSETTENNDPVSDNNEPYPGDTAVPPDAEGAVEEPKAPKPTCTEHNMVLIKTVVDTAYELYSYVTDHYECANCSHARKEVHIAGNDLTNNELASIEQNIIKMVNSMRVANGLPELWVSEDWNKWADTRAAEQEIVYGHRRPDGSSWAHAIGKHYSVGENVSVGYASGAEFYEAFYDSAAHRSIMMSSAAVGIAVGVFVDADGNTYCAMILIGAY